MSTKTIDTPVRIAVAACKIHIAASPQKVYELFLNEPHNWFFESEESKSKTPLGARTRSGASSTSSSLRAVSTRSVRSPC
jgi:hypothetical protein